MDTKTHRPWPEWLHDNERAVLESERENYLKEEALMDAKLKPTRDRWLALRKLLKARADMRRHRRKL